MIGGWICFGLGLAIMCISVWLVPVYGALLFAAFVLSIAAMAQKRIAGGLSLLLACIIVAPAFWFYLSATRTARTLDNVAKRIEEDNLKHGIGIQTRGTPVPRRDSTPVPVATAMPAVSPANASRTQSSSATAQATSSTPNSSPSDPARDVSTADAASMIVLSAKQIDTNANLERPAPCFSRDGERILYAKYANESSSLTITVRNLRTGEMLKSLAIEHEVRSMGWSPDEARVIFFDGRGDLRVADLDRKTVTLLPLQSSGPSSSAALLWRDDAVLMIQNDDYYSLNLDDLKLTRHNLTYGKYDDERAKLRATPVDHPFSRIYAQQIQNAGTYVGDYLMVAEKDFSYARALLGNFASRQISVSPSLRYVLSCANGQLTVHYIGMQKRRPPTYEVDGLPPPTKTDARELQAKCMEKGVPFRGAIYAPRTNPLNGKVIGPDRTHPKAWFRVVRWLPQTVVLQTVFEIADVAEGDVAADFTSDSTNENGYWTVTFDEQWRVLRPAEFVGLDRVSLTGNRHFVGQPGESLHDPARCSYTHSEEIRFVDTLRPRTTTSTTEAPAKTTSTSWRQVPTAPFSNSDWSRKTTQNPQQRIASSSPSFQESIASATTTVPSPTAAAAGAVRVENFPGERFPETRTRALSPADIATWSDTKLQYAINEMFARYGAEFGNPALNKWFAKFSWYQPRPGVEFDQLESAMSDVERQNLQLLGAYRTAKREALKQPAGRNQRRPNQQQNNPDYEEPNPVAQQLLQSILKGLQQGLNRSR